MIQILDLNAKLQPVVDRCNAQNVLKYNCFSMGCVMECEIYLNEAHIKFMKVILTFPYHINLWVFAFQLAYNQYLEIDSKG